MFPRQTNNTLTFLMAAKIAQIARWVQPLQCRQRESERVRNAYLYLKSRPMEHLIVHDQYELYIALIRINRPRERNALSPALMQEIRETLQRLDEDDNVRVIIITGNEQAFAAGAEINGMPANATADRLVTDQLVTWEQIRRTRKPLIAAVSGFCLGGGCELALTCDMIIASETAQFGQPEIKIGVMPGAGGTQRLARTVGKARAMELVLPGRIISADEARTLGMVNTVVATEMYLREAVDLARQVAAMSPIAVRLAKEAVNRSFETSLEEGLRFERKHFLLCFATEDQKEGMKAFLEKRKPEFRGK